MLVNEANISSIPIQKCLQKHSVLTARCTQTVSPVSQLDNGPYYTAKDQVRDKHMEPHSLQSCQTPDPCAVSEGGCRRHGTGVRCGVHDFFSPLTTKGARAWRVGGLNHVSLFQPKTSKWVSRIQLNTPTFS